MKNICRVFFTAFAVLTLTITVWAFSPPNAYDTPALTLSNSQDAQQQTVSGKIATVEKSSFTLTVTSTKGQALQQEASPKTMTFLIDKNTAVEGTLKVGANADVTYREDRGKNVAISVHVAS